MSYRVLSSADAFWRPSNQMGVLNTDLAKQLEATELGARFWRLAPGQASTRHRHPMRVDDEVLTLDPLSAVYVDPRTLRQLFNDGDADALWLVVGAPELAG